MEVTLPDWSHLLHLPLDTLLLHFAEVVTRAPSANIQEAPVVWKIPEVSEQELRRDLVGERKLLDSPSHPVLV